MLPSGDQCIAHHEAGHAVAAIRLGVILDRATSDHCFIWHPRDRASLENVLVILLSGFAAEQRFAPAALQLQVYRDTGGDFADAQTVLLEMGGDPSNGDLGRYVQRAKELVEQNWFAIRCVAARLRYEGDLDGYRVREIVENCDLIDRERELRSGLR